MTTAPEEIILSFDIQGHTHFVHQTFFGAFASL